MTHAYVNRYTDILRREETDTLVQLLDRQCDGQEVHPEEASIGTLFNGHAHAHGCRAEKAGCR